MNNYKKSRAISNQIINIMKGEAAESDKIDQWIASNSHASKVVANLSDENKFAAEVDNFRLTDIRLKSKSKLEATIKRSKRALQIKRVTAIAAALIAISFLVTNIETSQKNIKPSSTTENISLNIQEPTLILSDGSQVGLSALETINDDETIIAKDKSGDIAYSAGAAKSGKSQINTLIIPHKSKYSVTLSDGTRVILNANSKLTYPLVFSKDAREVDLEGEAFFEVTKGDVPFIVKSQGVQIKVYGTKFNVNSYSMNRVKTMLFEGSVGVSSMIASSDEEYMLKENQLSDMQPISGSNQIMAFNPKEHKSWTDGFFYSDGDTLEELLISMSKWYNVEFGFVDSSVKNTPMVGMFTTDLAVEDILKIIERVLKVKFIKSERGYMVN